MTNPPDGQEFQAGLQRLERLLEESEQSADPAVQSRVREVVRAILDLHAVGLRRMLERLPANGSLVEELAADDLVGGLLLLHGLHPRSVEERVNEALERVRPYLRSHGGAVELVAVKEGTVYLRLGGSCTSCSSSTASTQRAIEEAILARAPDVLAIEFEGGEAVEADSGLRVALPIL